MDRRKVLGIVGLSLVNAACGPGTSTGTNTEDKGKPLAAKLTGEPRKRALALALTVLLTNNKFRADLAADAKLDPDKITYGGAAATHAFKRFNNDIDRSIYQSMVAAYKASSAGMEAKLNNLGGLLADLSGAAGLTSVYMPPDCPCTNDGHDYPDCAIIDGLFS